jgi:hypothetical protein
MVPNRENPREFIIEPWVDYIGSGDNYDWSDKLDGSRDIQLEPVFFTQSDQIRFEDAQDTDYANVDNFNVFKEVYGTRIYRSGNELLEGETVINTVLAPTPVERVKGLNTGTFIIPTLASLEPIDEQSTGGLLKPIVAKPRLMFWNGMASTDGTAYFVQTGLTTTEQLTEYARMTYVSEFLPVGNSLNLNWEIEPGRWIKPPISTNGLDVFTRFWQEYIESNYNPLARKLTAYFVLDSQDLKVEFKDNIFIRDAWYRLLKIIDAPLNGINRVKVELIKLLEAPDAGCICLGYFITDTRQGQVDPWTFTYIDCETGDTFSIDILQVKVFVV